MPKENTLQLATREFTRMKELADRAMAQVSDEQFVAQLHRWDNSIAVVVKHMAGNMRSRWRDFLTSDGEKPDRHRDAEFELDAADTPAALRDRWEAGWRLLFDALAPLGEDDLERVVTIRGEGLTVLQAVHRQLTHYAYHVGQIVFLARHFAGDDWHSLSIAKGKSAAFNADPARYVDGK